MQLAEMAQSINLSFQQDELAGRIAAKLTTPDAELTPIEIQQANGFALARMNLWNSAQRAFDNGIISEATFNVYLNDIATTFKRWPGLEPRFEYIIDTIGAEFISAVGLRIRDEMTTEVD